MDSCLFRVKPDDERQQVIAELSERGLDTVPVVDKGELVGCLMEKEIAHLLEDDVTEDAQLQGQRCRWKNRTSRSAHGRCGKTLGVAAAAVRGRSLHQQRTAAFRRSPESAIALAFFIPLLIGTGGNSGTQITSTLVRSMALGKCDCAIWGG